MVVLFALMSNRQHEDAGRAHDLVERHIASGAEWNNQFTTSRTSTSLPKTVGSYCQAMHNSRTHCVDRLLRQVEIRDGLVPVEQTLEVTGKILFR